MGCRPRSDVLPYVSQRYKGSTIGNHQRNKKNLCIDYSFHLVKELALLRRGGGGGTTLFLPTSKPFTMPFLLAWVLQEKAINSILPRVCVKQGERKHSQLFFLYRKGRLNNCTSGEKSNKLPIQAKISCSWGKQNSWRQFNKTWRWGT